MRITLRQLHIFLAIAHSGSTTAAAGLVALSQSAVSAALNELEAVLGTQLFDRVGKRLLLNDSGRMLVPQARQMMDTAACIEQQYASADNGPLGHLHVGASTTIGIYILPAILGRYAVGAQGSYPRVTIANTAEIAQAVASYELDAGLIEGPCHEAELEAEPWVEDELIVVCAPTHPLLLAQSGRKVSSKALRQARWLLREPGSGTREAVEQALLPHLHALGASMEFGNSEAIKHAAAEGMGFACLSRSVVADFIASGRLAEVDTALPPLRRTFYLVYHRGKMLSAGVRFFLDSCRAWRVE